MSFNIALSGINAAQKDLDVTANNISNVNSIGFKESRAEFSDLYANSIFTNSKTQVGSGVQTAAVSQQFHQGSLQFTENSLDMAINGSGFFVVANDQTTEERSFTRAGAFRLNDEGYITNSQGDYLQTYETKDDGTPVGLGLTSTKAMRIPEKDGESKPTSEVKIGFNLPVKADALDPDDFDPTDSKTYTSSTSTTIYDSMGDSHTMTQYFVKDKAGAEAEPPKNEWKMFVFVDGQDAFQERKDDPADQGAYVGKTLTFDNTGKLENPPAEFPTEELGFTNGSNSQQVINVKVPSATLNSGPFEVTETRQDGSTVGRLTKVNVGPDGLIEAVYNNRTVRNLGIVAMARFPNEQGLEQIGDTQWRQSVASGEAVTGQPNTGVFGKVRVAALENSNTDLTSQLVDLITAQRNFQANSRALETNSTLMQTILQIR